MEEVFRFSLLGHKNLRQLKKKVMKQNRVWARFDDLRAGKALLFPEAAYELIAHRPDQIADVFAGIEEASRRGWWAFGFLSYEAASGLDSSLAVHEPVPDLPLAWFGVSAAPQAVPVVRGTPLPQYCVGDWTFDWPPEHHKNQVDLVRRHIAAGESYQCNLTTRVAAHVSGDLSRMYADLALAQKGSHNAYIDLGRFVIASASPELFFEIAGDRILMRPMKGTAPRGRTPAEDARNLAALRTSAKERAENIMIVDLLRNDVARIAETGSVSVETLCRAEQYPTVHQLTSDVSARLREDTDLAEVFRALFPCGSITGAPKSRTMQLIRELEDRPRGVYCGTIGMVAPTTARTGARFSVAIRTMLIDREDDRAVYGTGGGITWDSRPDAEYLELQMKTAVLNAITAKQPSPA